MTFNALILVKHFHYFLVMKYRSLWNLKIVLRISTFQSHSKYASTQPKKMSEENDELQLPPKGQRYYTPSIPKDKLSNLDNVTSVVVGLNHVSWAQVSVHDVVVLNWGAYSLPENFLRNIKETDFVDVALAVRSQIPNSELYVMEKSHGRWRSNPNDFILRSMLILLLSSQKTDPKDHKVIFQKPSVMNILHSLVINGERTSAKGALLKLDVLSNSPNRSTDQLEIDDTDSYSAVKINSCHQKHLSSYPAEKQESLSLSLLLALSFLNVGVYNNKKCLSMLHTKKSQLKK